MRKIRQHVNPLGQQFMHARAQPLARPPGLAPDCRLEVELGCADAEFSFQLATNHPDWWVVGLEIREACLVRNRVRASELGLHNLSFGYVNLNVDLEQVFGPATVDRFHLLFPDPWFKLRHHKRRVAEPGLFAVIARQLRSTGEFHFASDVFEVALELLALAEACPNLKNLAEPWSFARDNPMTAASRREQTTLARGQRVWRARYAKPDAA